MRVLLISGSFLTALMVKYSIYALWGVFAFIFGIQPIVESSGDLGAVIWSGVVAILSTSLVICILLQRRTEDQNRLHRLEATEAIITTAWIVNTALYPTSLVIAWANNMLSAPHVILIGIGYLVIPTWRTLALVSRRVIPDVT